MCNKDFTGQAGYISSVQTGIMIKFGLVDWLIPTDKKSLMNKWLGPFVES